MIIEAALALFCFGNGICYDTNKVAVASPEVATVVSDGTTTAMMVINCSTKLYRMYMNEGTADSAFEKGSVADQICTRYLPEN